ncbi:hypothetical protein BDN72DRAFT_855778 [Pluteus cervinus]|uniref:Uncharacterized protein n=1 Tax=Pluteus cervinus TaxID=181527 RepID=A0ACD3B2I4_9AGAR|nr:hypothetical protein BDN72DRAFT_855778 [Pluteus cervinus]
MARKSNAAKPPTSPDHDAPAEAIPTLKLRIPAKRQHVEASSEGATLAEPSGRPAKSARRVRNKATEPMRKNPGRLAKTSQPENAAKPARRRRRTKAQIEAQRKAEEDAKKTLEALVQDKVQTFHAMEVDEDQRMAQKRDTQVHHIFNIVPVSQSSESDSEAQMTVEVDKDEDSEDEDGENEDEAVTAGADPFDDEDGEETDLEDVQETPLADNDDEGVEPEVLRAVLAKQDRQVDKLKLMAENLRVRTRRGTSPEKRDVNGQKEKTLKTPSVNAVSDKKSHPTGLVANYQSKLLVQLDKAQSAVGLSNTKTATIPVSGITARAVKVQSHPMEKELTGKGKATKHKSTGKKQTIEESVRKRQQMGEIPRNNDLIGVIPDPDVLTPRPAKRATRPPIKVHTSIISLHESDSDTEQLPLSISTHRAVKADPSIIILSRPPSPAPTSFKRDVQQPPPVSVVTTTPESIRTTSTGSKATLRDLPSWLPSDIFQEKIMPTVLDAWCSADDPAKNWGPKARTSSPKGHTLLTSLKSAIDAVVPGSGYQPAWGDVPVQLVNHVQMTYRISDKRGEINRHVEGAIRKHFDTPKFKGKPDEVEKEAKWSMDRHGPAFYSSPVAFEDLENEDILPFVLYLTLIPPAIGNWRVHLVERLHELVPQQSVDFQDNSGSWMAEGFVGNGLRSARNSMAQQFEYHFSRWETGEEVKIIRNSQEATETNVREFLDIINGIDSERWAKLLAIWKAPVREIRPIKPAVGTVKKRRRMHIGTINYPRTPQARSGYFLSTYC